MSGERKNILVVEDNLETQLIIKVALRDNYKIELTNNATNAISLLDNYSFDLVLLDINLNGEESGKDVLSFLRKSHTKSELPVLVMTAYDLSDEDKAYFDENTNAFISTQFVKNIICGEVEKLIAKSH